MVQKRKILTISDHSLGTSGVSTQSRFLFQGLVSKGRWSIRSLGAAIKHGSYDQIVVPGCGNDFIIKPIDGFGDANLLRQIIVSERPDALLLFTDPRFFESVWRIESEIRAVCPIAYWHLWDSPLAPEFNRYVYESVDLFNCINWHTYEFTKKWCPDSTNYVPHAVPKDMYYRLDDAFVKDAKVKMLGAERADHFIVLYASRNAQRKMTPDVMVSFRDLLDRIEAKHGHRKASLIMHTDPIDAEGTNLPECANMLGITNNVVYSKDRVEFAMMNVIYNMSDVLVSRSSAEGFGLTVLEAKMAEKPVVALMTGGVGRQVKDHITGEEYGVALEPDVVSYGGNLMCPYITNDYVSNEKVTDGLMRMFELGEEGRREIGVRSRAHALRDYDLSTMIDTWDRTLWDAIDTWKTKKARGQSQWTSQTL